MPISHSLRCVFVHVPKCAGSSLTNALTSAGADFQFSGYASLFERRELKQLWLQHAPVKTLRSSLNEEEWNSYFKFAFVRNPWDWLVSLYHYHFEKAPRGASERLSRLTGGDKIRGFQHWARIVCCSGAKRMRGATFYLTDDSGAIAVDFIGRYENLEVDYNIVCQRLGIPFHLPHLNSSNHKNYKEYYSNELRDLVHEAYQQDITHFNYSF